ncbi:S1 RNA-binding domain-containing protein [Terribacillus saccharophilus]|uniref:S1 RNA-binding domain-containing protein n=1 Tax=Terribacillus saccharophilus TaxID=361277 RepID=UPI00382C4838
MTETLLKSWNSNVELEELANKRRTGEITRGAVSSTTKMKMPTEENGRVVTKEVEVAIFRLEGGIRAYCPASEFSAHEFSSLIGFVGSIQEFVITALDLENEIATVSVKKADEIKSAAFWEELRTRKDEEALSEEVYEGVISGYNPQSRTIFVKVNGTNCFMNTAEWDHGRVRDVETQVTRGSKVEVKVLRIDEERQLVQVSRRAAIEDPFDQLEQMKDMEGIAGKITNVHPIHGIFVQLDNGLEVKGIKPRRLQEPDVGDIVSCRIRTIDKESRRCKVVIYAYPRGKKQKKDVASFLFD